MLVAMEDASLRGFVLDSDIIGRGVDQGGVGGGGMWRWQDACRAEAGSSICWLCCLGGVVLWCHSCVKLKLSTLCCCAAPCTAAELCGVAEACAVLCCVVLCCAVLCLRASRATCRPLLLSLSGSVQRRKRCSASTGGVQTWERCGALPCTKACRHAVGGVCEGGRESRLPSDIPILKTIPQKAALEQQMIHKSGIEVLSSIFCRRHSCRLYLCGVLGSSAAG